MNMLKKITLVSMMLAMPIFLLNNASAATAQIKSGKVSVSCPAGLCATIVGVLILGQSERNIAAGGKADFSVKACDKISIHGEGLIPSKHKRFTVQPCSWRKEYTPVHFGQTIVVTGALYSEKYYVTGGYPAEEGSGSPAKK